MDEDRAIHICDADRYLQLSSMFQGNSSFCLFCFWGGFGSNNGCCNPLPRQDRVHCWASTKFESEDVDAGVEYSLLNDASSSFSSAERYENMALKLRLGLVGQLRAK